MRTPVPQRRGPAARVGGFSPEALARDGVSREVPCSALKGETVPDSLPASFLKVEDLIGFGEDCGIMEVWREMGTVARVGTLEQCPL